MEEDSIVDESLLMEDDAEDDSTPDRKDAIVFMVDAGEDMFKERPDKSTPFKMCIDAIVSVYKNKIISSDEDLMAVIFYNTKQSKNATNFAGISVPFSALEQPRAAAIKYLQSLKNDSQTEIEPGEEEIPLGNVFWTAANMYGAMKSATVGSKRIFAFTSNDTPHADNQGLRRAARTRAKDLADFGIDLELFNMQPFDANKQFDLKPFWGDIVAWDEDAEGEASLRFPDASCKFEELLARIRRRESRKRTLRRSFLSLLPDYKLSIRMYSIYQPARKANYQWVDAVTNAPLKSKTEYVSEETGEVLNKTSASYSFDYGGTTATLSADEVAMIKSLYPEPGLSLIKFIPKESILDFHNISHSIFIFPDDGVLKGSKAAFSALLQSMLDKQVVAICRLVPRKGLPVRLVALMPQQEELDEIGTQLKPAGLVMIPLPFKDDIREPELDLLPDEKPSIPADCQEAAVELVTKLTLQDAFNPDNYENPSLQRHYAYLQALALDEDEPEPVIDLTVPNGEMIEKRAGHILKKVSAFAPAKIDEPEKKSAPRAKKPKIEQSADHVDDPASAISIECDETKLSKFTVPQLKAHVESMGAKPARLKADLISQIMAMRTTPIN